MIWALYCIVVLLTILLVRALHEIERTKDIATGSMNHFIHHLILDGHVTEQQVTDILDGKRCNHENS